MPDLSPLSRESLRKSSLDTVYDLVIVGGGITGCGVALDAALRSLKVLLVERGDLACGTSSRSSRLVHGGLRYLEHYHFRLVRESVRERWRLMQLAPHLVRPLPFVFPVYTGERPGLGLMNLGTFLYSLLSAFRTPGKRQRLSAGALQALQPGLAAEGLAGAAGYYDCATNDARLTLEVAMGAAQAGAAVLPYVTAEGFERRGKGVSVHLHDGLTNERWPVQARTAILAAGPWTDEVLQQAAPEAPGWLRPTKGVHLVFRSERLPLRQAVVMKSVQGDGRITFAIPWGSHSYVGTTDTDHPELSASPAVTQADIRYLLDITNRYFPAAALTPADVVSSWAGLRPLVAPHDEVAEDSVDPSDVSREEKLEVVDDRYVVVAGGKLTTYRVMAENVVDRAAGLLARHHDLAVGRSVTKSHPLPGAEGGKGPGLVTQELIAADLHVDPAWLNHLAERYGTRAPAVVELARHDPALMEPLPGAEGERLAEVDHAIRQEGLCRVEDFLVRRSYIHYRANDRGHAAARAVADRLIAHGIVSPAEASAQISAYRESI